MVTLRAKLAVLLSLTLAMVLSGCGPTPTPRDSSPGYSVSPELRAAGESAVEYALTLDGIEDASMSLSNGAILDAEVAEGADPTTVLISARKIANFFSPWESDESWQLRLHETGDRKISADVYQSRSFKETDPRRLGELSYFADALAARDIDGIDAVHVNIYGQASVTVSAPALIPSVVRWFAERGRYPTLKLPSGTVYLNADEYRLAEGLIDLVVRVETQQAPLSLELAGVRDFSLRILTGTKKQAQKVEELLLATTLKYEPGEARALDYEISYGDPVGRAFEPKERESLQGSLNYTGESSEPTPTSTSDTPEAGAPSPGRITACAPATIAWTWQRSYLADQGHTATSLALSNLATEPCSLQGYPRLRFTDGDGDLIPVTLTKGFSDTVEYPEDEGVFPFVLGPGEQAVSYVQWRTNQVNGYSRLPHFMQLAPAKAEDWSDPVAFGTSPNIIDDSEIRLSPWFPPSEDETEREPRIR